MSIRALLRPSPSAGIVGVATVASVLLAMGHSHDRSVARCGSGFRARGTRCSADAAAGACPEPLIAVSAACDAPDIRINIPPISFWLGPSDWEAEGRVSPRWIRTDAFRLDAFEATVGHWRTDGDSEPERLGDRAQAASGMTRDEAAAYCTRRGGRLPTEDEWMAAAAFGSRTTRRYPWGDTGAVCRRAAWGLFGGPCSFGATGPDTVGAHADGDSPLGLHDLAGNVAEWVSTSAGSGDYAVAKGGSWASAIATELRIWSRLEVAPYARDPRIGVRCAYSP